jgi:hypothetical protein
MDPEWRKVRWQREMRKVREAARREGRGWLQ